MTKMHPGWQRTYSVGDFGPGDRVRHRQYDDDGRPMVSKQCGYVRELRGQAIWVYMPRQHRSLEFLAWELVPA